MAAKAPNAASRAHGGTKSSTRRARRANPDTVLTAILDVRDPLVHADARTVALVGPGRNLGDVSARSHQTFLIAGVPSRPLGRTRRTRIRIPKTVRSDQRPPR